METVYKLKSDELNMNFLETIKQLFPNQEILLSVIPVRTKRKTIKYSKKLLTAMENVEKGKTITLQEEEYEALIEKLLQQ